MEKILKRIIIGILFIFGSIFFLFSNQVGGFRLFIVSSASMEPTLPTGSLILTKYTNPKDLQKDDIITFLPPEQNSEFVTHRITKINHQDTLSTFRTKGDNNNNADLWILAGGAVVGKVIYTMPYLGFFVSFIKSKIGIILFVLLPAVYIIVDEILTSIQILKDHKKKKMALQQSKTIK